MTFRKDSYRTKASIVACVSCILGAALFFIAAFFSKKSGSTDQATPIIFLCFALFGLIVSTGCVFLAIDNNRKVVISTGGITMVATSKTLLWDDCRAIGIFGYYYGMKGTLFFSPTRCIFSTQNSCRTFYNKHYKEIISIAYTPEVFAAIEKFAPPHLVNSVKILMR